MAELEATISECELREWMAYAADEGPFGPERADLGVGVIASTLININQPKGKQPVKATDLAPKYPRQVREHQRRETAKAERELRSRAERSKA